MDFVSEVTAKLENKPGRLAKICSALAHEKVNIRALTVMDSGDHSSVLRVVTDEVEATRKVLTSLGTESQAHDVLAVDLENKPGSLAKVLERLAEEHINIDYAYTSAAGATKALGIFHTDNPKKAQQVLAAHASNGGSDSGAGRRPLHSR